MSELDFRKHLDFDETPWMDSANCLGLDPDLFFPERGGREGREALEVCRGCEVRAECLAYALDTDAKFGVWGGTTEADRRKLRRQRRRVTS